MSSGKNQNGGPPQRQEQKDGDQAILLLAHIAEIMQHSGEGVSHSKRTRPDSEGSGPEPNSKAPKVDDEEKDSETTEDEMVAIFAYLTPSDLRLTAEALTTTNVANFRCNVNGCKTSYRSHKALARHRKVKHADLFHKSHGERDDCALQASCKEGHCGVRHECEEQSYCGGKLPHCHEGMKWPPELRTLFRCPEPSCDHGASQVQSLRYHYMRTHMESKLKCSNCDKTFALKTDLNRHEASCTQGVRCECGKMLRTQEGLETHRRIFHRTKTNPAGETQAQSDDVHKDGPHIGNVGEGSDHSNRDGQGTEHSNEDDEDQSIFLLPEDFNVSEAQLFSKHDQAIFRCGFKDCSQSFNSLMDLAWHRRTHSDWVRYTGTPASKGVKLEIPPKAPPKRCQDVIVGPPEDWQKFKCTREADGCSGAFASIPELKHHLENEHGKCQSAD